MSWFEFFKFTRDPYELVDPYQIAIQYLGWDRADLPVEREKITEFVESIVWQKRVALRIFGPPGAGKTWLTRLIEKELEPSKNRILFIYTKIPRIQPTFEVVYRLAMDNFLKDYLKELGGMLIEGKEVKNEDDWKNLTGDPYLGKCLFTIATQELSEAGILARKWLTGDKLSAPELKIVGIPYSLDTDYERFAMLVRFFRLMSVVFSSVVFAIDELDNAPVKLAASLGDGLRDILDQFAGKFGLICAFTAESLERWYDLGYTEMLTRRINYTVGLQSLQSNSIQDFLSVHNQLYRGPNFSEPDQSHPFTKKSLSVLLEMMSAERRYPGYYLPNCGVLARQAAKENKVKIDVDFVKQHFKMLPFT